MQNPRVSLSSVGAREVGHGNARPTTRTARFFPYTNYGRPRTVRGIGASSPLSFFVAVGANFFFNAPLFLLLPASFFSELTEVMIACGQNTPGARPFCFCQSWDWACLEWAIFTKRRSGGIMAAMRLFWQSRIREAQTRFLYWTWVQK